MDFIERRVGNARIVFTDRHGGVSRPPYDSLNLADHVGDEPAAVAENRRRLEHELELGNPARWGWLRQVHGRTVVRVGAVAGRVVGDVIGGPDPPPEADAAVTTERGRPLVVLTADCAPIALVTPNALAVVHAGWHGLVAGVVEAGVDALRAADPGAGIRAVLGPCVRPGHYEFGPADLARVVGRYGPSVAARTVDDHPALDVAVAVRIALAGAGVTECDDVGVCTVASPDHFSHRRDGSTGRQALVAVLDR